ncbi:MAG: type I methionyl aminopeptidase [Candidatus Yanofskybacteria bacterium RIFCSPHIGHO2_02_FULL_44_12b]|uniref:Methionine aminopeptidase n=2 Tax=Candidatus Yanofskyibacteriota TaxID=1752733 RepID=A0A1F8GIA2_9BACT|nr:MAG: Methionine aminopeptidase [Candidatus Yanofskybacteria bacterium GW2011_GWA2_44_9]OGN04809.1 MAG: type I methionyl aminopeptidase [Candidatus Yanofskybacteria bacterium RIFCSPHIGHO2_01_FULL_44_24]OGN16056.1 MAG: type I methionyl aminopeptidase [Candidatus Yanofskybacteria bacterium RIFCSPHIGHO2_02_FULL_44_12b]OGN25125.1 MAG: type I methionyl aminopeptidase [Candidatus Yanofskybacteria bacterium RIFCSPLOWO2_01_FULL_44_22]
MINLKTKKEIEAMREGGRILKSILEELKKKTVPGVTTGSLNKLANELILKYGAKPSFLGYGDFPAVLCVSVNDEIVHGVPSERKLKEGDLCKLDFGVLYKGFHTDSAVTVLVTKGGKLSRVFNRKYSLEKKLISVTKKSLEIGIAKAVVGNRLGDIGAAIQKFVEKAGFGVVRDLVGHGIGKELHESPQVPNYGKEGAGEKLVPGMVIAIEPMVVTGSWKIKDGDDGFVFTTKDGGLAAHFEHTVAITEKEPAVLTG